MAEEQPVLVEPDGILKPQTEVLGERLVNKEGQRILCDLGHDPAYVATGPVRTTRIISSITSLMPRTKSLLGSTEAIPAPVAKGWDGLTSFPFGHFLVLLPVPGQNGFRRGHPASFIQLGQMELHRD